MSFSISFPVTVKADFDAAVDAAVESPLQTTEQGKALVAGLKVAAKALAAQFDGNLQIGGSASGHVCEDTPGVIGTDNASVTVGERLPPANP